MRRLILFPALILALFVVVAAQCPPPNEVRFTNAYVTSYNWWDNNPPHSAEICCPSVHETASGAGTVDNPITVAVDYVQQEGGNVMQYAPGTLFYIPNVRAYFVVEDRTGELAEDNSAQHHGTTPHLDVWSDGRTSTEANASACMDSITHEGLLVVENPANNYAVVQGPLAHDNVCRANFGNALVTG